MRTIDGDPLCPNCEVVFREVATLGGDDDPGSVSHGASGTGCAVGRLSTGEFLVGGITGGGRIFVYDANGRLQTLTGEGEL